MGGGRGDIHLSRGGRQAEDQRLTSRRKNWWGNNPVIYVLISEPLHRWLFIRWNFRVGSFCDGSFCTKGPSVTGIFRDETFCEVLVIRPFMMGPLVIDPNEDETFFIFTWEPLYQKHCFGSVFTESESGSRSGSWYFDESWSWPGSRQRFWWQSFHKTDNCNFFDQKPSFRVCLLEPLQRKFRSSKVNLLNFFLFWGTILACFDPDLNPDSQSRSWSAVAIESMWFK